MPRLSLHFIRTSLIYLLYGFTFGGLLFANKGPMISRAIWMLLPIHIEFELIGWLVQLAMGVAFWILLRLSKGPIRGNEPLSWFAFILINTGILLVESQGMFETKGLILIVIVFETLAMELFATGNWRRIKAHGIG